MFQMQRFIISLLKTKVFYMQIFVHIKYPSKALWPYSGDTDTKCNWFKYGFSNFRETEVYVLSGFHWKLSIFYVGVLIVCPWFRTRMAWVLVFWQINFSAYRLILGSLRSILLEIKRLCKEKSKGFVFDLQRTSHC